MKMEQEQVPLLQVHLPLWVKLLIRLKHISMLIILLSILSKTHLATIVLWVLFGVIPEKKANYSSTMPSERRMA